MSEVFKRLRIFGKNILNFTFLPTAKPTSTITIPLMARGYEFVWKPNWTLNATWNTSWYNADITVVVDGPVFFSLFLYTFQLLSERGRVPCKCHTHVHMDTHTYTWTMLTIMYPLLSHYASLEFDTINLQTLRRFFGYVDCTCVFIIRNTCGSTGVCTNKIL